MEPCYHSQGETAQQNTKGNSSLPLSFQQLGKTEKSLPVRKRIFGRAWPFGAPVRDGIVTLWPQLAAAAGSKNYVPCFVSDLFIAILLLAIFTSSF